MAIKNFTGPECDVPTSGTRVRLITAASLTDFPVFSYTIQADIANTNGIWVGDDAVAVNRGTRIAPGQAMTVSAETTGRHGEEFLLGDVYIDTDTNGNDFWFSYVKRR